MKTAGSKILIYDLEFEQLQQALNEWGVRDFRSDQIWHCIYKDLYIEPSQFTTLPIQLRNKLSEHYSFNNLTVEETIQSHNSETQKTLFRLPDGNAIETVLMDYTPTSGRILRQTICLSTQVGCALGCQFCATGQMGFIRNLTAGEIIEQTIFYERKLRKSDKFINNIVFMGMGEPFLNYDATIQAIKTLNNPNGFNLGARRFTISTIGLPIGIEKLSTEPFQINLAVSLHAADDDLRSTLLPINKKYPIKSIIDACKNYLTTTNRRITFEWTLISGINDTFEQAHKLSSILQSFRRNNSILCHVNLIPLNPTLQYGGTPTDRHRVMEFKKILSENNIPCSIRSRKGINIQAGCGQLATLKNQ